MGKKSMFSNNQLILRDGDGPLFGFDCNDKDNLKVEFVNLNGYTIIPNEQFEAMKDEYELRA